MRPSAADDLVREGLDVVRAAPRIDDLADARLILDIELRVARNACREIRRQSNRLIECVRMERLRVPEGCPHCLHRRARDVVERILRRQRPAGRLAVRTQRHRLVVLRVERLDDLRPEDARRTHLCNLHEVVLADRPEERETLCEVVDGKPCLDARADVLEAVGQRVAELDVRRCPGLLHMVAGDGDAVELRHILRRVLEDVADDAHGHIRRVDVGVADHELFQNIILNCARHDLLVNALLLARDDEESENRQNRTVHRHRDGHLIKRNAREQDVHIQHGADRNARLADVADNARIVRIIAAMGREVKRDRETFLTGREVAAIERIGLFCRRETCVLAHRPRTEDVHRGVRPAQAGRNSTREIEVVHVRIFINVVIRLDGNALHGLMRERLEGPPGRSLKEGTPLFGVCGRAFAEAHPGEIRVGKSCHYAIIPFFFCSLSSTS